MKGPEPLVRAAQEGIDPAPADVPPLIHTLQKLGCLVVTVLCATALHSSPKNLLLRLQALLVLALLSSAAWLHVSHAQAHHLHPLVPHPDQ